MKSRTGAAILLVGTFLLGGVTGAISYSLYRTQVKPPETRTHRGSPPSIVEELGQGLSMDAQQKEQLKGIIRQSRERYRELSKQFRPSYDAIRDQTRQEIRQILREDQKERFEEIMRNIDLRQKRPSNKP